MVARNVVDSQRRSDPGSIPGGANTINFFHLCLELSLSISRCLIEMTSKSEPGWIRISYGYSILMDVVPTFLRLFERENLSWAKPAHFYTQCR